MIFPNSGSLNKVDDGRSYSLCEKAILIEKKSLKQTYFLVFLKKFVIKGWKKTNLLPVFRQEKFLFKILYYLIREKAHKES